MPSDRDENEVLRNKISRSSRVAVKVGSSVLAREPETFNRVIKDIFELRRAGKSVVLVSSGAIALGMQRLNVKDRPKVIPELQALAAVGQSILMRKWQEAAVQLPVAQVLLTHADLSDRGRYLNARHALKVLTDMGVLPIINENDTVAVDEIKFGDNDTLSAMVAGLWEAEALVILSDIDGLFDADPNLNPHAERIPLVTDVEKAKKRAGGPRTGTLGTGGMITKLNAVDIAHAQNIPVIITTGAYAGQLAAAIRGDDVGTLFWPDQEKISDKKHWLANVLKSKGKVHVDDGARAALIRGKRSLLPAGVRKVEGKFDVGDAIDIYGPQGDLIARGLVGYDSREATMIMGKQSAQIIELLGYRSADELVHRDDLVVFASNKDKKGSKAKEAKGE
ncbi:MAG: glutamate 5-kinase [Deltaproteobacteria bacterium]|nr:glutamate 5-kinase [Deltaproteobacteria bacterium]